MDVLLSTQSSPIQKKWSYRVSFDDHTSHLLSIGSIILNNPVLVDIACVHRYSLRRSTRRSWVSRNSCAFVTKSSTHGICACKRMNIINIYYNTRPFYYHLFFRLIFSCGNTEMHTPSYIFSKRLTFSQLM